MTQAESQSELSFREWEDVALTALSESFHSESPDIFYSNRFGEKIGCDKSLGSQLFWRMLTIGALEKRVHVMDGGPTYHASATIDDIIEARNRPVDRVTAATEWMRSHKFWSLAAIVLLVLYFLTGLIKNVTDVVDWAIKTWG
jgi:hypothetical protein